MRILILGGDGMLGHQLLKSFSSKYEVKVTLRRDLVAYDHYMLFDDTNAYPGVDVGSLERIADVLADFRPQAVINAVGIVKQRETANEIVPTLKINSLFPHRLAKLCKIADARLLHMSTDCVFSGKKGNYHEADLSDAEDFYGKTKFLGEVYDSHCLTFRTSIIGRELSRKSGLLEWFIAQTGTVKGFKNAIFTGFTTLEMSRIIEDVLQNHPKAFGVYHVSSDPISKYDLLLLFQKKFRHDVRIVPEETFRCDRSLDSSRFRREFGYTPPTWEEMIEELSTQT